MKYRRIILILSLLFPIHLSGQLSEKEQKEIVFLQEKIKNSRHDSTTINAYIKWDMLIYLSDPQKDKEIIEKVIQLSSENLREKEISVKEKAYFENKLVWGYNSMAISYDSQGKFQEAIKYYEKAIKLRKKKGDSIVALGDLYNNMAGSYLELGNYKEALSKYVLALKIYKKNNEIADQLTVLNNMGSVYESQGNYSEALRIFYKTLKEYEKENNKIGIATSYVNMGIVYVKQEKYPIALQMYLKALKIRKQGKDKYSLALLYNNIGIIYLNQKKYKTALKYYNKSLKFYEEFNDKAGMADLYNNIGVVYENTGKYKEALNIHRQALILREEVGDKSGIATSYNNLGTVSFILNRPKDARNYQLKANEIANEIGFNEIIRNSYHGLALADSALGNYKNAFINFRKHIVYRDSMINEEHTQRTIRLEMQYEFDKKSSADSIVRAREKEIDQARIARQDVEIELKNNQQYALFGGLALLFVFAFFMYNRFKVTQRQKNIIEGQKEKVEEQNSVIAFQKHEVEEKNKEIMDSINYAKRIQEAILPSRYSLVENLRNGFVLYKPKDIVAGDFYWLEKQDNKIYYAAADCTGHGVPGAMVSVVCSNALSKALLEEKIDETGKILDRTRELVIEKLSKGGEEMKDGMDISLVCLELKNEEIEKMYWSGANNPLWRIRKNDGKPELKEYKPDKQPIGKYAEPMPFTTHEIDVMPNDFFYVFTDGYVDQFGGEHGKKFKAAKMKELFLSVQNLSMDDQKEKINETFEKWKGHLEQVDDVCVIGIRI